jgi:hypothetical protein
MLQRTFKYVAAGWAAILISTGALCGEPSTPELFPTGATLDPAVKFWEKVYLEITSQEAFLHDTEEYVIYNKLTVPELAPRAQLRWLKAEKRAIKEKLVKCAHKQTNDLCSQLPTH